ncbi:MAG: MMPL family transporter [Gaiellaceae bacterium]
MSPFKQSNNIAARMGRWSARHRKAAVLGWLAFVLVAVAVGLGTGMKMLGPADSLTGESASSQRIVDGAGLPARAHESVLVQSSRYRVTDRPFRTALAEVSAAVGSQVHVKEVRSPLDKSAHGLVSRDGHSALVQFELEGDMIEQMSRVAGPLGAVAAVRSQHAGFRIEQFGDASFAKASNDSAGNDFKRAEYLSLPVTVIVLVLAFGAFVAAVLPVLLALSAFAGALGLVLLTSHFFPIDHSTFSVMLLIGLAVGVDYSLFYIRREREERSAGRSAAAALEAAAATSGRAVLVSGMTVMVAVGGLFLTGAGVFRGMAAGTILVVATSVLGSVTVLPAVLSKLGERIESGRVPWLHRHVGGRGESRFWNAVLTPVLRRPLVAAVAATGTLVVLALPAFGIHTLQPGFDDYPQSLPILATYAHIEHAFPGGPAPAQVAVRVDDAGSRRFAAAVARFRAVALATGELHEPITAQRLSDHVAVISVPLAGTGDDDVSELALRTLRKQVIPATLGEAPGVRTVAVGGNTAASVDFNETLGAHLPLVFAFVLGFAFLLLLVTFRSLVIALKAIVLNLLSVAAAYGFLVAVFQWGWGERILGFHSNHGITAWIPLFLFVVLFGLSMDYHVFIISRIREAFDRGLTTEEAVSHGIRTTAGVVTSAAAVMVGVFSIFGSLGQVSMKEVGIGLAFAVLLDATIVRAVLLPASMKMLGDWNWWLPKRLSWLPRSPFEGSPEPV